MIGLLCFVLAILASPFKSKKLIAERLGVAEQEVVDMNGRLSGDVSLNSPIPAEGDSGEWQDWLVDHSASQETRAGGARRDRQPLQGAGRRAGRIERARASHIRGAPIGGRADHA
jgi:hypothetical protein